MGPEAIALSVPVKGLLPEAGDLLSRVASEVISAADPATLAEATEMAEFSA